MTGQVKLVSETDDLAQVRDVLDLLDSLHSFVVQGTVNKLMQPLYMYSTNFKRTEHFFQDIQYKYNDVIIFKPCIF